MGTLARNVLRTYVTSKSTDKFSFLSNVKKGLPGIRLTI